MADPTIPGLEVPPATALDGPMERAAAVTLQALQTSGVLEPRHAVLVQLVRSLAGAIDRGVQSGRASAVAMAAKQLLETMLVLDPPPEEGTAAEHAAALALEEFVARLERHANGEEPPAEEVEE